MSVHLLLALRRAWKQMDASLTRKPSTVSCSVSRCNLRVVVTAVTTV